MDTLVGAAITYKQPLSIITPVVEGEKFPSHYSTQCREAEEGFWGLSPHPLFLGEKIAIAMMIEKLLLQPQDPGIHKDSHCDVKELEPTQFLIPALRQGIIGWALHGKSLMMAQLWPELSSSPPAREVGPLSLRSSTTCPHFDWADGSYPSRNFSII
eukprot:2209712-Rhodomonas_salina.1